MARISDQTRLVHMNLPGVHDAATGESRCSLFSRERDRPWLGNYSDARQAELLRYTGLWVGLVRLVTTLRKCSRIPPADTFRCQERSFFEMLNDGIRVFDMRYAYNPGNDTIGFYHCMYASATLKASSTNQASSSSPPCSHNPIGGRVLWFLPLAQSTPNWGGPHIPESWGWYRNT